VTSARWARLEELFEEALAQPAAARGAWLAQLPATERASLERLLEADAVAEGPLDRALEGALIGEEEALPAGTRAGAWEVVGELGRGGMGQVYAARRADGLYEQQVALKVLAGAPRDPELGARFAAERAILARLEHPGIARLLDAGFLADGTPFVALEQVEGRPIDEHCAERRLAVEARLALFERVVRIVAFAHRRFVLHCDLKPANVLVTADGEPKLLDFGIARLLGAEGGSVGRAGRWLTPAFASPEQLRGEELGVASDVFSLGALLRVLVEPPAPRRLRRDLEAILARALADEPAARYASAEALADDLERLRRGFPVAARAGTWSYRATRFLRRHRVAAWALLVATLAAAYGVARIEKERRRAERERETAEQVADFLAALFRAANPLHEAAGSGFAGDAAARAARQRLLDEGARRVRAELLEEPRVRARLLLEIGDAYRLLGAEAEAEAALTEARALRHGQGKGEAEVLLALARLQLARGRLAEAESLGRQGLDLTDAGAEALRADLVNELGLIARAQGDRAQAAELLAEALARRRTLTPPRPDEVETSLNNLALLRQESGDAAGAEPLLREALTARRARLGPRHLLLAYALNNLASVVQDLGRLDEAGDLYAEALDQAEGTLGPRHAFVGTLHNNLGTLALARGEPGRARRAFEAALTIAEASRGAEHPEVANIRHNLGVALHALGASAEAARELEAALRMRREAPGLTHPDFAASLFALVAVQLDRGHGAAAEAALAAALEAWKTAAPAQAWAPGYAEALRGRARARDGARPHG
jgi:eukaryotic-like serine/threonine-protein kinase